VAATMKETEEPELLLIMSLTTEESK